MKRQDTELHIRIDPLQPDGQNWLQAEATQGDVEARIDIRPYRGKPQITAKVCSKAICNISWPHPTLRVTGGRVSSTFTFREAVFCR